MPVREKLYKVAEAFIPFKTELGRVAYEALLEVQNASIYWSAPIVGSVERAKEYVKSAISKLEKVL